MHIQDENKKGYLVIFIESGSNNNEYSIECYKKHATAILKSILIGKFPIPIYNNFKNEIDSIKKQTVILEKAISKPEFSKYTLQKKLNFNLE